jgi:type II secretory pathway pseudopilin PulG
MNMRRLKERGDTIVEVLIAIAVISLVLQGAYVTTHKSLIATRDAQEHAEALKLLEGQIESIRSYVVRGDTSPFATAGTLFCMPQDGSPPVLASATSLPPNDSDTYAPTAYKSPECKGIGPGGFYNIANVYSASSHLFNLTIRWDGLGGTKDQVTLAYRIYP